MHGDKSQRQRERALASFENGSVETLVATDVAARGIDVADIAQVVNFDVPDDREAYVHRIGRTGRAGRRGIGISFVLGDQAADMGRIAFDLGLASEFEHVGRAHGVQPQAAHRPGQRKRRRRKTSSHGSGQRQKNGQKRSTNR